MSETEQSLVDRGLAAVELEQYRQAHNYFQQAVTLAPCSAAARINLGAVLWTMGDSAGALRSFEHVLLHHPDNPYALINSGVILAELDRLNEAIARLERGVAMAPDAYSCHNLGLLYRRQTNRGAALKSFEQGLTYAPDDWLLRSNRAIELLALGRFAEGWAEYEHRRGGDRYGQYGIPVDRPTWCGEIVEHLLVHYEQGFGDTIQNCRYIAVASERCRRLTFVVPPNMVRLMEESWKHNRKVTVVATLPETFCAHVWVDSLPGIFDAGVKPIPNQPYLSMPRSEVWQQRLAPCTQRRVGVAHAGRSGHKIDERRSASLAVYDPFLAVPGVDFFSLQVERKESDPRVIDVSHWLFDWAETAALIQELDLVITVDTAVCHLAGALGKPVWMLNRFDSCWRWLMTGSTTEWYPSMRIFRQPAEGDWQAVVQQIRDELLSSSANGPGLE
jgi:hypothetical protein